MKLPTLLDSRGNPSQTLFWVSLALIALLGRFLAGIFTDMGQVGSVEFATAFTVVLAPFVAREAVEKLSDDPSAFRG